MARTATTSVPTDCFRLRWYRSWLFINEILDAGLDFPNVYPYRAHTVVSEIHTTPSTDWYHPIIMDDEASNANANTSPLDDPMTPRRTTEHNRRRHYHAFAHAKQQGLYKADKSSAGTWDVGVREVCGLLNGVSSYYTTSSCSGRCLLYTGSGGKATNTAASSPSAFTRWAVSHDPIETEYWEKHLGTELSSSSISSHTEDVWIRMEPFLLHVACRSMGAARQLLKAARPVFKNVGVTTWNESRCMVAIWGDEGLDMPLVIQQQSVHSGREEWLTETINDKFRRNQSKLDAFTEAIRNLVTTLMDADDEDAVLEEPSQYLPRHYDIIGDIAVLHTVHGDPSKEELAEQAETILARHPKTVNVVAFRATNLEGPSRVPGNIQILAGPNRTVTTHREYGVACVVDVAATFFSPRMASERFRLCQQQQKKKGGTTGGDVLVLFCGVGVEAFLFAVHAHATTRSVTAVDQNPVAMECASRGLRQLRRNNPDAAAKVHLHTANVMENDGEAWARRTYDRILVPRPKLPAAEEDRRLKESIWTRVLSLANPDCCHVHWYDFCPAHEAPKVGWMQELTPSREVKVQNVANVGSVAHRQIRVCIDLVLLSDNNIGT